MQTQKTTCLIGILCLCICCSPKSDGVEAEAFSLENILTVDTEDDETAEMGITDISHFDVDSEGKIFIFNRKTQDNYIFMLNKNGSLVSKFGKRGQGPGELQNPRLLVISDQDEIVVTDSEKVVVFSNAGEVINEFRKDTDFQHIIPLRKDRYLAVAVKLNQDLSQSFQVILCSSELEELKILDSSKIASFQMADKVNIIPTLVYWETSGQYIYTGNTDEYEIRVFDFDGEQIRKISKAHDPISLSAEDKEAYERRLENYPPDLRDKFFIPEAFPPFRDIVASGDNMLFVQTYEELNEGSSWYDIFNPEGEFIGRTEFEGYQVKLRGDSVYCLKQKDSGYIELVVYKKIWD